MTKTNPKVIKYQKSHPWNVKLQLVRNRCNNKNNNMYYTYGGRGIKCFLTNKDMKKLWFRDKADEMKRPSIDRIDNDKDYTYDNCQIIELSENVIKRFTKDYGDNLWKCYKCGEIKDFSYFYKCSKRRTGYGSICKECRKIEARSDKAKQSIKEYRDKNRERINKKKMEYYYRNKYTGASPDVIFFNKDIDSIKIRWKGSL